MKRKFKNINKLREEIDFLERKIEFYKDKKPAFTKRLYIILEEHKRTLKNWEKRN